jgi:hypothetical protein
MMMMWKNSLDGKMHYCIYVLRDACRNGFLYVFSNNMCLSINYIMHEIVDGFGKRYTLHDQFGQQQPITLPAYGRHV